MPTPDLTTLRGGQHMKLAIFSNAPWCATGYGQQTKQLTTRLVADGHEVAVIANWGLTGAPQNHGGLVVFPQGQHPYSIDTADGFADYWLGDEGGRVIVLYDVWPLMDHPDLFKKHDTYYWTPIDHQPVPPKVHAWAKNHQTIAMAEWGQQQLAEAGIESDYIPHAVEAVFRPTPSDWRDMVKVPQDAHVSTVVSANIGMSPPRKRWAENLIAWRMFAEQHDDAYLYLHTQLRHQRGIDLVSSIELWGLPTDRVRIVDQFSYAAGFVLPEDLARIYTASDVLLQATAGEGFGIPAIEAQACGTPVIVTDFSAQPELVGAGWRVDFTMDWDQFQGAAHALPSIPGIRDALEASYIASKDPAASEALSAAGIVKAAEYDADLVYDRYWRPWLAKEPAKPNRQQRRRKKGRAA